MRSVSQLGLRVVVVLIAVTVPVFLVVETLVRVYVLGPVYGPIMAELLALYWPQGSLVELGAWATTMAWVLIGLTTIAGVVGVLVLRRTARRALAEAEDADIGGQRDRVETKLRDQLLLLTSIPQVPGLLAALCLVLGSELTPVLICVVMSTAFVIAQGFIGERMLERSRFETGTGTGIGS